MAPSVKARPTTYKGVQMRSRLEAGFAAWLDDRGVSWEYEPQAFASESGQYLPDFRVPVIARGVEKHGYIEVKPYQPDTTSPLHEMLRGQPDHPNLAKLARKMSVIWGSDPSALPLLIWPGLSLEAQPHDVEMLALLKPADGADRPPIFLAITVIRRWADCGRLHLDTPEWVAPWPDGYWEVQ